MGAANWTCCNVENWPLAEKLLEVSADLSAPRLISNGLKPFLDRLGHKARQQMCPVYVSGLVGPGDRKSIQPMAERLAPGDHDQMHHFIATGVWDAGPLERELLVQADKLISLVTAN